MKKINKTKTKKILKRKNLANFYSNLFKKFGDNPKKALGRYDLKKSKKKFNFIYDHFDLINKKERINILDIGCGIGQFLKSKRFSKNKINYSGIDISKISINFCKKKFKNGSNFYNKDIFEKNKKSHFFLSNKKKFDIIFSFGTIEQKNYLSSKNNLIVFLENSIKYAKKESYIVFDYFYKENLDFVNKDCNYLSLKQIIEISKKFSKEIQLNFQVSKFEVLVSIKL